MIIIIQPLDPGQPATNAYNAAEKAQKLPRTTRLTNKRNQSPWTGRTQFHRRRTSNYVKIDLPGSDRSGGPDFRISDRRQILIDFLK